MDADAFDRSVALFHDPKDTTRRDALDDWLASPLDPRQAQAEADFGKYLMMSSEEG